MTGIRKRECRMGSSHSAQRVAGTSEAQPSTSGRGDSCPVPESVRRGAVYDVYSQRIDGARGQDAGLPQCLRQVVASTLLLRCAAWMCIDGARGQDTGLL